MKVIKLGGSVITNKRKPLTYRSYVTRRIARELKDERRLIVIHGGGSFGHYIVKKYGLNRKGFCLTRYYMEVLNNLVVRDFLKENVLCTGISTFSLINKDLNLNPILKLLNSNIVPIIFGDIIIENNEYRIVSGDALTVEIANKLNIETIIFLVDVDGILDQNRNVIKRVNINDINDNIFFKTSNATGGMREKINQIKKLRRGVVYILNGLKKGLLYDLLKGREVICTKIFIK